MRYYIDALGECARNPRRELEISDNLIASRLHVLANRWDNLPQWKFISIIVLRVLKILVNNFAHEIKLYLLTKPLLITHY